MPDPISIPPNKEYVFQLQPDVPRDFTGTMTISSTTNAYIAKRGDGKFQLCTRTEAQPAVGAHVPVDLTVTATNEYSVAIPTVVISFILDGPEPPAGVSSLTVANGFVLDKLNNPSPTDPGSATIPL